jgi:hypothetical protein
VFGRHLPSFSAIVLLSASLNVGCSPTSVPIDSPATPVSHYNVTATCVSVHNSFSAYMQQRSSTREPLIEKTDFLAHLKLAGFEWTPGVWSPDYIVEMACLTASTYTLDRPVDSRFTVGVPSLRIIGRAVPNRFLTGDQWFNKCYTSSIQTRDCTCYITAIQTLDC